MAVAANQVAMADPNATINAAHRNLTETIYDNQNRAKAAYDANGASTTFVYNEVGDLITKTAQQEN